MNRNLVPLFLITIVGYCALTAGAQDDWGPFDRLVVTQKLLDAVYADLEHYEGVLLLRAVEFHTATGQGNVVDLVPCHPGSGYVTYFNLGPGQEPPTHCGDGRLLSKSSDFLSMDVTFGKKYPVSVFGAGGSFVHAKSEPVEKQIAAHPEWNDHQRLETLRLAGPRFGPENKAEFLRAVPADARCVVRSAHGGRAARRGSVSI